MMCGPTTDHEEIRRWAEAHNAVPAEVFPHLFDGEPAVLRFLFGVDPIGTTELRPISWENFFAHFDLLGLALVYDDQPTYELLQIEDKSAFRFDGKPL